MEHISEKPRIMLRFERKATHRFGYDSVVGVCGGIAAGILLIRIGLILFHELASDGGHLVATPLAHIEIVALLELFVQILERRIDLLELLSLARILALWLRHFVLTRLELLLAPFGHLFAALGTMDFGLLGQFDFLLNFAHIPIARIDLPNGTHQIFGFLITAIAGSSRHALLHALDAIAELLIGSAPWHRRGYIVTFAILLSCDFILFFFGKWTSGCICGSASGAAAIRVGVKCMFVCGCQIALIVGRAWITF